MSSDQRRERDLGEKRPDTTATKTESGGASRDRTGDLYNAIVALSQLSYGPTRANAMVRVRGSPDQVSLICRFA